jgi:N-acetylmuramic acid 6-phosphate etherase
VIGALRWAREVGSHTVAIVNNARSALADVADTAIELLTGPEVIAGSTRLCAGTAQKIALGTLSSAVMVRLGKTYGPYMVDVRATNAKLRRRALRMVHQITGADSAASAEALAATDGRVKPAVVMLLAGCDADAAERRLDAAGGRVRDALSPKGG